MCGNRQAYLFIFFTVPRKYKTPFKLFPKARIAQNLCCTTAFIISRQVIKTFSYF